ncbi:alkyl/aryl-sulfatase [Periweissella ghanensis]|uniref:Alkyl/aryl-sulfatase YjcS n=1 Tax=Periweissella ghanensis TaxID=467997 RepID=A0ABN8BP26_9LACO|nr:alkyl/aryl-sulfatase [Periweissella ghanensis]MCM0600552.1 alkyl/aryl-sulfatase [Periweissella ghanensis]CAH0418365.1 Putative alkyl/aryl-sulfatase YjcS [Periweissella ghanensis]
MLVENGAELLTDFATINIKPQMKKIGDDVYFFSGYGTSNVIAIEGQTSVILIDTLESPDASAQLLHDLQKETTKPVKTIIYTHGHPDHRGGASTFKETVENIFAFNNQDTPLTSINAINHALNDRGAYQMGYHLSNAEALTMGIGKLEGHMVGLRGYEPLQPTEFIANGVSARTIDGVLMQLATAPGENGDMGYIWLPDQQVLCCGDNYYGCFPNLAPIRGGQYRDIGNWLKSLDLLVSYDAQYVLPGHLEPLIGAKDVKKTLSNYRDALSSIFNQTLLAIDQGLPVQEVVETVHLPEKFKNLPYLAEIYGTVEWSVRAIFAAYVGWFDGNPTNLHSLPTDAAATKMINLIGGASKVESALQKAITEQDYLWALELCDLLLGIGRTKTILIKAQVLRLVAEQETTATGRHYYLSTAKELEAEV